MYSYTPRFDFYTLGEKKSNFSIPYNDKARRFQSNKKRRILQEVFERLLQQPLQLGFHILIADRGLETNPRSLRSIHRQHCHGIVTQTQISSLNFLL